MQRLGAARPARPERRGAAARWASCSAGCALLVLDNFEDNLALGGGRFADETAALLLDELLAAAGRGKLLITSRYPLPEGAGGDGLAAVHLPPLSPAETRRFFHRLEGLATTGAGDTQAVLRRIGGHPRTLEYLDALLRRAPARLAHANRSLRAELRRRGLALEAMGGDLDSALRDAAQLAAGNILLDELLAEAGKTPGDLEVFMQAAVYPAPVETEGLAWGRAVDGPPDRKALAAAQDACDRLAKLSLLTPAGNGRWFVHRWTAESLPRDEDAHRAHCRRAGEYHLWRMATASHDLNDAVEAVRLLLAAEAWDRAAGVAWQIVPVLRDYGQTVALTSFLNEVVSALPESHEGFPGLSVTFGDALLTLGFASAALEHYDKGRLLFERLAAAEPDRADYQRDLSVSFNKMGDLFTALGQGEQARLAYQRSLDIRERLAAAEPDRADYQRDLSPSTKWATSSEPSARANRPALPTSAPRDRRTPRRRRTRPAPTTNDLSVSYERMGDLFTALGQGEQARLAYQRSLEIAERLAAAEPDRADYQRDLSVSFNKMGDLFTALGQGEQARLAFQQALEIRERLAAAEPDRADAAWDLVVSLWRMATLDEAAGRQYFERALAIMQPLHAAGRLFPEQVEWMRRLEEMLGEGEGGV
ncbi:MAG: tetratricopeptide repeat protein [Caldilineales bacterium]